MSGRPVVCGFDLGGTKLLGLVVDRDGEKPLAVEQVPTPTTVDDLVNAVVDMNRRLLAAVGDDAELVAVGMGAPGLVDRAGVLRYGPHLPGIVDVPLSEALSERLGVPAAIDNDANCAAWAEHERGASRGMNHSVMVTLGTGIGGGITVNGELLRGAHGFSGEIGHMVVDPNGPPCPCGRRGCWERFGSGSGLGRLAREAADAGSATRMIELAGGDPAQVTGEHVTQAAGEGDAEAQAVLDRFAWWVALGLANLVNMLDSEIVVLGGGLVAAGDLLLDPVRAAFNGLIMGSDHRDPVPIVVAELGTQAGAWGAALLADARVVT
ncbi:MAG: ROK family protein [Aquihabitans sp.]